MTKWTTKEDKDGWLRWTMPHPQEPRLRADLYLHGKHSAIVRARTERGLQLRMRLAELIHGRP